jgi:hypothetical protein
MINKKLNLEELKVRSFVTSLNESEKSGVKGGYFSHDNCPTHGTTQVQEPLDSLAVWCGKTGENCDSLNWCSTPESPD